MEDEITLRILAVEPDVEFTGVLSPEPLLLIQVTEDAVVPDESSRILYQRAGEPKTLRLFFGTGYHLTEVSDGGFDPVADYVVIRT